MANDELTAAREILVARYGVSASPTLLTSCRLPGGTEAAGVFRIVASYDDDQGWQRQRRLVVKHLTGRARREARILQDLGGGFGLWPSLLGAVCGDRGQIYLGLEDVRRTSVWPWRDSTMTAALMRELGQFHETSRQAMLGDAELRTRARRPGQANPRLAGALLSPAGFRSSSAWAAFCRKSRQGTAALEKLLLNERPFEAGLIHGDVHPGNALIRNGADERPVLIDWGRTRRGSPLEDVSSMLQSLRLYEPTALQRHDTLLKDYLTGRGWDRRISDSMRSVYWVAGASNALAGALGWHLMIAADEAKPTPQRQTAFKAARDWLRGIRRAHAWAL